MVGLSYSRRRGGSGRARRTRAAAGALLLLATGAAPGAAQTGTPDPRGVRGQLDVFVPALRNSENGTNPTDVRNRVDISLEEASFDDGNLWFLPRVGYRAALGTWGSAGIAVPLVFSDFGTKQNVGPNAPKSEIGIGDTRLSFLAVTGRSGDERSSRAFGFGFDYWVPTGDRDRATGVGQQIIAPLVAVAFTVEGILIAPILQDYVSLGGDQARRDIHDLHLRVLATYTFPERWWLTFDPEAIWDLRGELSSVWIASGELGFMLSPRTGIAIETEAPISAVPGEVHFEFRIATGLRLLF